MSLAEASAQERGQNSREGILPAFIFPEFFQERMFKIPYPKTQKIYPFQYPFHDFIE